jgi:hypothetical protein
VIGNDCPSFPAYQAAFRAFFYGDFAGSPSGQMPSNRRSASVPSAELDVPHRQVGEPDAADQPGQVPGHDPGHDPGALVDRFLQVIDLT